MSSESRENLRPQTVPVYTLYPGSYQTNADCGFHQSQAQAPPPKYEDVISGKLNAGGSAELRMPPQQPGPYEEPQHAGVIFVAPAYKYTKMQKILGLFFTILFLITFVSIVIKVLSFR